MIAMLNEVRERMTEEGPHSTNDLVEALRSELRRLASAKLRSPLGVSRQSTTTSLVHEACIKLYRSGTRGWDNERHFYAAASKAMRDVLVDDIRRRSRRATAASLENLEEIAAKGKRLDDDTLLDLVSHLEELRKANAQRAEVVDLKFFAGMTTEEIANILGMSDRAVSLHWQRARGWLHRRVSEGNV